jgi:hypothetical protein
VKYGNPRAPWGRVHSWTEEFRRALAREDLALSTVRAYRIDLEIFSALLRPYHPEWDIQF